MQGGEVNESTQVMEETVENIGAGVMGRNMFGPRAAVTGATRSCVDCRSSSLTVLLRLEKPAVF